MSETDLQTRDVSVPFTLNHLDIETGASSGRYRFVVPDNMNITECYLTIELVAPDDQDLSFKLAIGNWGTGDNEYLSEAPSQAVIDSYHRRIAGTDDKYSVNMGNTLLIDGINLKNVLPVDGDSNFKKDAFVLIIDWDEAPVFDPDPTAIGSLSIRMTGSALLGVL